MTILDPAIRKLWTAVILQTISDFSQSTERLKANGPGFGWDLQAMKKKTLPGLKALDELEHLWFIVHSPWFDEVCDGANSPKCKVISHLRRLEDSIQRYKNSLLVKTAKKIRTWMVEENPLDKDETLDQGFRRAYARALTEINAGNVMCSEDDLKEVRKALKANKWIQTDNCGRKA